MKSHEQLKKEILSDKETKEMYEDMAEKYIMEDLVIQIQRIRKSKKLTYATMGKSIGCTSANVQRFAKMKNSPSIRNLVKIARVLDCELIVEFRPREKPQEVQVDNPLDLLVKKDLKTEPEKPQEKISKKYSEEIKEIPQEKPLKEAVEEVKEELKNDIPKEVPESPYTVIIGEHISGYAEKSEEKPEDPVKTLKKRGRKKKSEIIEKSQDAKGEITAEPNDQAKIVTPKKRPEWDRRGPLSNDEITAESDPEIVPGSSN